MRDHVPQNSELPNARLFSPNQPFFAKTLTAIAGSYFPTVAALRLYLALLPAVLSAIPPPPLPFAVVDLAPLFCCAPECGAPVT